MSFPNVLKIAKNQFKSAMSSAVAQIQVSEWKDDAGNAVVFHVFRLSSEDLQTIAEARRSFGEQGAIAMTVARSCYLVDGSEKKRAFVDTDLPELLKAVDSEIMKRIYDGVSAAL